MAGRLFLIPNTIAEETQKEVIPSNTRESIKTLRHFLAEDIRTARRYLSSLKIFDSIEALQFSVLNKDTKQSELPALMAPLHAGDDIGIISESGCPGVADPGSIAVGYAHEQKIIVVPLVGPSSILLALMASGLNGQQFVFNGYLPIESGSIAKVVAELEKESRTKNRTQIFIETPYRNNSIMKSLLTYLHPETMLCVALGLTSSNEKVTTLPVRAWKQQTINFPKSPAIFLFLA